MSDLNKIISIIREECGKEREVHLSDRIVSRIETLDLTSEGEATDLPCDDTGRITSDYEPTAQEIEVCRNAICREFGNNGTDGYYIRILKAINAVRPAPQPARPNLEVVAWQHTLNMDGGEMAVRLARAEIDRPWGKSGIDFDDSFRVDIEPLVHLTDAQAHIAALTAKVLESEKLRGQRDAAMAKVEAERAKYEKAVETINEYMLKFGQEGIRAETAEARNAELVKALEPFTRRAPVQGFSAGISWDMHLRAYDVYCDKYGPQKALIESGCRGGFSTGELDGFIPGWRDEVAEDFRRARAALGGQSNG